MKETWAVNPGETLELKMKFTDHIGIYMMHCHILEHEDDGMMTQFEVVDAIGNWRYNTFGTTSDNGDPVGGDAADPDGDGVPNIVEYALGSDPKTAGTARVPKQGRTKVDKQTYLTLTFPKLLSSTAAISYSVEESLDGLKTWSAVDMTANLVGTPVDQGDGTALVTIRGNAPMTSGSDFLRLRISAP